MYCLGRERERPLGSSTKSTSTSTKKEGRLVANLLSFDPKQEESVSFLLLSNQHVFEVNFDAQLNDIKIEAEV